MLRPVIKTWIVTCFWEKVSMRARLIRLVFLLECTRRLRWLPAHAWGQLPVIGDVGGSLANIRQGPDEPYQNFVDRLLIAASRILGKSDTGSPFVMQLVYENTNSMCRAAIQPHKGQTDLAGYVRLCAEIRPPYNQGLAFGATLQETTVQAMFSQK